LASALARALACPACGSDVAERLLSCPRCHRLVHGDTLRALAAEAESRTGEGDAARAADAWRRALELLPPGSTQHAAVLARLQALSAQIDAGATPAVSEPQPSWVRRAGPLGVVALAVWKLKFLLVLALTKGKLLLLGLGNAGTLLSMMLSFGVYWTAWGWRFALGLVGSMYVHEMGHVVALRRFGIRSSAPMFIPGFGALVRLHQYPVTPAEDARVGLAGPLWGLGAALACYVAFLAAGAPIFGALARAGAWLNLFNLLPAWQLDGSRGFRALSREQRFLVSAVLFALWGWTREGMLLLLLAFALLRTFAGADRPQPDRKTLAEYVGLAVALSALAHLHVPMGL
jgi:Zn-dependent protease